MATARQKQAAARNLIKARAARKHHAGLSNISKQVKGKAPIQYRGPFAMSYPITSKPATWQPVVQGRYAGMRGVVGKPIKGGLGLGPKRIHPVTGTTSIRGGAK
jgi:hypothetical protein